MRNRFLLAVVLCSVASIGSVYAAQPVRIPLVVGLTRVLVAWSKAGDQEQVISVTNADADRVDFAVEFGATPTHASYTNTRRVRRADLQRSNRLNGVFEVGDSPAFPGSTLTQLSAATLAELKTTGKAAIVFAYRAQVQRQSLLSLGAVEVSMPRKFYRGNLVRDLKAAGSLSVLVNGKRTALPVVNAGGDFSVGTDHITVHMAVLDDPANAMLLGLQVENAGGATVRLDFPQEKPKAKLLATALSQGACRAELTGIYFEFGKSALLPPSKPALRAVADMMNAHGDWRLRIEGHTDNVGGASFNKTLSLRRASAVLAALTGDYKLAPTRLSADGLGADKPVASNDTLSGRAANRRVELSRTCP